MELWFLIVYLVVGGVLFFVGGLLDWFEEGAGIMTCIFIVWPISLIVIILVGPFYGLKKWGDYIREQRQERRWHQEIQRDRERETRNNFFN